MVDPDLELTPTERSDLAMTFHSKGWQVVNKLLLAMVEQFRVDLDNADHSNPKDVMAKHSLSRSAGIVVTQLIHRINNEVGMQVEANLRRKNGPEESAPGLQMDDLAQATEHLPNLLGDVNYIAEEDSLEEGR